MATAEGGSLRASARRGAALERPRWVRHPALAEVAGRDRDHADEARPRQSGDRACAGNTAATAGAPSTAQPPRATLRGPSGADQPLEPRLADGARRERCHEPSPATSGRSGHERRRHVRVSIYRRLGRVQSLLAGAAPVPPRCATGGPALKSSPGLATMPPRGPPSPRSPTGLDWQTPRPMEQVAHAPERMLAADCASLFDPSTRPRLDPGRV